MRFQAPGGFGVEFERSDARDGFAELRRGRAVTRANFEDIIAEARAGQDPGKQLPLGENRRSEEEHRKCSKPFIVRREGNKSVTQEGGGQQRRGRAWGEEQQAGYLPD